MKALMSDFQSIEKELEQEAGVGKGLIKDNEKEREAAAASDSAATAKATRPVAEGRLSQQGRGEEGKGGATARVVEQIEALHGAQKKLMVRLHREVRHALDEKHARTVEVQARLLQVVGRAVWCLLRVQVGRAYYVGRGYYVGRAYLIPINDI